MEFKSISMNELLLDVENPRHEKVDVQAEAIEALIEEQGSKLVALAEHIVAMGISPLDRFLVIPTGRNYTVVEGNRRFAVIKLLNTPDLARGTPIEADIKRLSGSGNVPKAVECAVAESRDAARPWMELRHAGELGGAGVVRWHALQQQRFKLRPGTQAAKAITFLDGIKAAYPKNEDVQNHIDKIGAERLTTFGRLVGDPNVRDHLGLEDEAGHLVSHYPANELEKILERFLSDVATHLSVTKVKTKAQRTEYLRTLAKPSGAKYESLAKPLQPVTTPRRATTTTPRQRTPKPGSPFKGLALAKLGPRLGAILSELKQLDVDKYPNAAALLTRALIELSVDQVYGAKGWKLQGELKNRVKRCLHEIDPTDKANEYQAVRTGLSDGTSVLAVATLHGYVHNPHFHPTGTEIRTIVENYKPFLEGLEALA